MLGQSFGGEVAMTFAAAYPQELSRLILLSATAQLRMDRALPVFERLGGPEVRQLAERYWSRPTPKLHAEYHARCLSLYTTQKLHPDVLSRAIGREAVASYYNGARVVPTISCHNSGGSAFRLLFWRGRTTPSRRSRTRPTSLVPCRLASPRCLHCGVVVTARYERRRNSPSASSAHSCRVKPFPVSNDRRNHSKPWKNLT